MIRGTLFETVEATMTFIVSHMKVAFEITGKTSQRTEIFEYPLPAIRELVLNAIIHRDYTSPTDIQIRIFDKEITIFNPGKLFGDLTVEDLKTDDYQAQSRNKQITEAFYLTKDIEKYGSGFRRIREQIAKYPTMYFEFEENSGGFLAKIGYKEQKTSEVGEKVGEKVSQDRLSENQATILKLIASNNTITIPVIAEQLGISARKTEVNIRKLKEKGYLQRIGSARSGYWHVVE